MIITNKPNLTTSLKSAIIAVSVLISSTKPKDATLLKNILGNLHGYRRFYPEQERLISRVIFKIHDMAYYGSSELMRQNARVGTFCGFALRPTKDMSITKGLLNRMALVERIDDLLPSFKVITNNVLKTYADQNHQQKDMDASIAHRVKNLMQIIADRPGRKNFSDYHWLHETAIKLAQLQPEMKNVVEHFPAVTSKTYKFHPKSVRPLGEAPVIHARSFQNFGQFLRGDHD